MEEFPVEVSNESIEEKASFLPNQQKKYNMISYWKVAVLWISFWLLVYAIPNFSVNIILNKMIHKEIKVFNENTDSYEKLNPDSLQIEIGKNVLYDVEFTRHIFEQNSLNFEPFEKRLREPHNELWAEVIYGKLIRNTVIQFFKKNFQFQIYFFQILHIGFIVVGMFLLYFIYTIILKPIESENYLLRKFIGNSKNSFYISLLFFCLSFIIIMLKNLLDKKIDISFFKHIQEVEFIFDTFRLDLLSFVNNIIAYFFTLGILYFLLLFLLFGFNTKFSWFFKTMCFIFSFFYLNVIVFGLAAYFSYYYQNTMKMYQLFLSAKIEYFIGIEKYIFFFFNNLLILAFLSYWVYFTNKLLHPAKNQLRLLVMAKHGFLVFIIPLIFLSFSSKWSLIHKMVTHQYTNALRTKALYLANETSASVYQYYHTQKDAGESVTELPDSIFDNFSELINTKYTKTWDGEKLEFYFQFESTYPDSLETIHYSFEPETAEKEHKIKKIAKPM
jgi:hypothetical protein